MNRLKIIWLNSYKLNAVKELKSAFESNYGRAAEAVYFSPGCVNLIGEYTDYNGGSVFPCTLSFGAYLLLRKNGKNVLNFWSLNQPEAVHVVLDHLTIPLKKSWVNYPLGAFCIICKTRF